MGVFKVLETDKFYYGDAKNGRDEGVIYACGSNVKGEILTC